MALGLFGALTKLKSAANDLPYTSQVALGLFGQCYAQARKINGGKNEKNNGCIVKADSMKSAQWVVAYQMFTTYTDRGDYHVQVGTLLSAQDVQSLLSGDVLRVSYYREKQ